MNVDPKLYIPVYDSNNCVHINNEDVIRVYDSRPTQNSTIHYRDYYIHSDYIYNEGTATFNQYSALPVCVSNDRITTDVYYRVDLPQILIVFIIMTFVCFVVPWRIFLRMFRRYQ